MANHRLKYITKATLKYKVVSCGPAGWGYFTALLGRIFFFFFFLFKLKYFCHFSSDFQTVFTIVYRMIR